MKLPYKFLSDKHWYEDCLHVLVGLVPFWGWLREHWQFGPGDPIYVADYEVQAEFDGVEYFPSDRVQDAYRDFAGYSIGDVVRTAILVGLLIWRW